MVCRKCYNQENDCENFPHNGRNSYSDSDNVLSYQDNIRNHYEDYMKEVSNCEECMKIAEFTGHKQSPIDFSNDLMNLEEIVINKSKFIDKEHLLTFKWYNKLTKVDIIDNDGGNVLFSLKHPSRENMKLENGVFEWPSITGGPLADFNYKLLGFHFHWSLEHDNDKRGSEHILPNFECPAELHLVHWNSTNYECSSKAVQSEHGLAVVGVLLKTIEDLNDQFINDNKSSSIYHNNVLHPIKPNHTYDIICKWLNHVKYKGQSYEPKSEDVVQLSSLLPINNTYKNPMGFFHYQGSLTTPPFNENVKWIVFNQPDFLKKQHLKAFRQLHGNTYEKSLSSFRLLGGNYRNVQNHFNRKVMLWTNKYLDNNQTSDSSNNALSNIVNFYK